MTILYNNETQRNDLIWPTVNNWFNLTRIGRSITPTKLKVIAQSSQSQDKNVSFWAMDATVTRWHPFWITRRQHQKWLQHFDNLTATYCRVYRVWVDRCDLEWGLSSVISTEPQVYFVRSVLMGLSWQMKFRRERPASDDDDAEAIRFNLR